MTSCDIRIGRNLVEFDPSWRPKRQPDWFDRLCSKLKTIFNKKNKV
jgi:hypothetical protein